MVRIGVTGAAGFIGGILVRRFTEAGHEVRGIDDFSGPVRSTRKSIPVEHVDIRSPGAFDRFEECDVVLHLAASSGVVACANDPVGTATVNIAATEALARWCADHRIPLAFASSFAVVGIPDSLPIVETTPPKPTHEYARQKADGERRIAQAFAGAAASAAVLRMSNVYGRYTADEGAVSKGNVLNLFAEQAATGELKVNAPGTQRRDYVHLLDVVAHWEGAVWWLLANPRGGVRTFNVASTESATVLDLAATVARHWKNLHPAGAELVVRVVPNPRGAIELLQPEFEVSRAETERTLGVKCTHSLEGSIDRILRKEDLYEPPPVAVARSGR